MRLLLAVLILIAPPRAWAEGWGDDVWGVALWNEQDERCDGADQNYDGAIDEGNVCRCKAGSFFGSDYLACRERSSYFDADAACVNMGSSLVEIDVAAENDWLMVGLDQFWPNKVWWIGANDIASEGTFEWPSGAPFGFTDWYGIQPDNDQDLQHCVGIWPAGSGWFDMRCDRKMAFICES